MQVLMMSRSAERMQTLRSYEKQMISSVWPSKGRSYSGYEMVYTSFSPLIGFM